MELIFRVQESLKNLRETRLSALRPPGEFFDVNRVSRPADFNTAVTRITYNTRHFSGNYLVVMGVLAIYALVTNSHLLIAIGFLCGGFIAINKWAPEPLQVGDRTVTQKHLYTALFVIGIPLLWWAAPFATMFWVIGASSVLILGHAAMTEPGVESEYTQVAETV